MSSAVPAVTRLGALPEACSLSPGVPKRRPAKCAHWGKQICVPQMPQGKKKKKKRKELKESKQ